MDRWCFAKVARDGRGSFANAQLHLQNLQALERSPDGKPSANPTKNSGDCAELESAASQAALRIADFSDWEETARMS